MDSCGICGSLFKRHYRRGGERQIYCSRQCKYAAATSNHTCKTCGKRFQRNSFGTKSEHFCSLACIQRHPCQLCGQIITGRKSFRSGEKRFCSRKCASIINATLRAKTKYTVFGFAQTIKKFGSLCCERCRFSNSHALVVHHIDRDRQNNSPANLETLCANCHKIEHHADSANHKTDYATAISLAKFWLQKESV